MISINTAKLNEAIKALDGIQNGVKRAYNSEWNDPVHESFGAYLDDAKKHEDKIRSGKAKIDKIVERLKNLAGGEQLANEAQSIKGQIASI